MRYDLGKEGPAPFAFISIEELSSTLQNGQRRSYLFEDREQLDQYLKWIDGEGEVLKLVVRPSS